MCRPLYISVQRISVLRHHFLGSLIMASITPAAPIQQYWLLYILFALTQPYRAAGASLLQPCPIFSHCPGCPAASGQSEWLWDPQWAHNDCSMLSRRCESLCFHGQSRHDHCRMTVCYINPRLLCRLALSAVQWPRRKACWCT